MFWKRKPLPPAPSHLGRTLGDIPGFNVPCPVKDEFKVMMELLVDAERYDTEIDSETCKTLLALLKTKIESFLTKPPKE